MKISATFLMCVMVLTTLLPVVATITRENESPDWSDDFQDTSKIELSENLSLAKNNVTLYRNGYADTFTGPDTTVPDNWNISTYPMPCFSGMCNVGIVDNKLEVLVKTHTTYYENATAWTNMTFNGSYNLRTDLDIFPGLLYGEAERCIDTRLTIGSPDKQNFASLVYDKYTWPYTGARDSWQVYTRQGGTYSLRNTTSNITNAETGIVVSVNVTNTSFEPVITWKSNGSVAYQPGIFSYDTLENWSIGLTAVETILGSSGQIYKTHWDNLSVRPSGGVPVEGKVRSVPIVLPQNRLWSNVHINSSVPSGTFLNISILDSDNKTIATGSGTDINISSLDYASIKLEAVLEGTESESPILQGWSVSWVPDYPRQESNISELSLPEDTTASFLLSVHFNDSRALRYSIGNNDCTNIPITMTEQGNLTVAPKPDWNGACTMDVLVSDEEFEIRSNSFKVKVLPVNDEPVFTSIPATSNATVGENWHYKLSATDIDGDSLTFGLGKSPAGMVLTSSDIDYLPVTKDNGTIVPVNVSVTDGASTVWQNFTVGVDPIEAPSNDAPVFISTPETLAINGTEYVYDANATDTDGDVLTFGIASGPDGSTVNAVSGVFKWTPSSIGPVKVILEVMDDKNAGSRQTFTILVTEKPNVPPTGNNTNGTVPPNGNNTNGTIPPNGNNTNGTNGTIPPNGNNTNGTNGTSPPDGGTDNGFLASNLWPIVAVLALTGSGLVGGVAYYKKKSKEETEKLVLSEESPKSTAIDRGRNLEDCQEEIAELESFLGTEGDK